MKLILCGGGCGEQNKILYDKLNEIIDHNKNILYIPLAMDEKEHPYDGCLEWITGELSNLDIKEIEMVRTFEELSKKDLNNYSSLYIGGGNTYKLLKGLKESKSFDKIKEYLNNDGIVLGSSAGSVIFSKDIDVIKPMDPNEVNLKDTKGFNILDNLSIFPHYINHKKRYTEEENKKMIERYTNYLLEYSKKEQVIAIPEEDAIYINDNNVEIIGSRNYYVFDKGIIQKKEIKQKVRK